MIIDAPKQVTVTLPALVRLNAVEIVHIGERIPASTGPVTITQADLRAMVAAARDPNAPAAILKIGHTDPRFDGEPGYGRLTNMRLNAQGNALLVDIVGVPAPLAYLIQSCWPSRSIEFAHGKDLAGQGLGQYQAVCIGVALLGVTLPAITRLDDVYTITGAQGNEQMNINELSNGLTIEDIANKVRELLRPVQGFLQDMVTQSGVLSVIFEEPDGSLYQAPINVDGQDVTLGEQKQVYRTYADTDGIAHALSTGKSSFALGFAPPRHAEELNNKIAAAKILSYAFLEANTADAEDAIDESEDAAEDTVDEPQDATPTDEDTPAPLTEKIEEVKASREHAAEEIARELEAARALVAEATEAREKAEARANALEQKVANLSQFQASVIAEQRAAMFSAAIKDGRILPNEREGMEKWASVDPEGFAKHLASLTPTRPTSELGYAGTSDLEESVLNPTKTNPLAGSPWDTER